MAAARIAITPSALEKKLSPPAIKQFRSFASRQCMGVWMLHLQLELNQPSQHHPFSRAFCSFYVMNPIEPTPQNNHDGRRKRRRLIGPSPGDTPAIDLYVSLFNRSPVAASIPGQSAENRPSNHHDDDDSFTDRPFTQDPSLLPPPTSPSAIVPAVPAAAKDVSNAFVRAPPTFLPLKDIPLQELQIIKDALRDVYGITEPRDFQLQAIHYLCFYDNPTMFLLRATANI
jgi:hypothetical protein